MSVLAVTDADFSDKIAGSKQVVVKYYADWCGSCKLFAPKYKRLSADERFENITFLEVNAEENPDSRKAAGVNNLPSFAIFKDGLHVETISTSKEEPFVELLEKL